MCISIELYEIVQLRSGDGVALPLTVDRCRPDVEGGSAYQVVNLYKKKIT